MFAACASVPVERRGDQAADRPSLTADPLKPVRGPGPKAAGTVEVPDRLAPFSGLGTWIDAYDWTLAKGKDGPLVEPLDITRMADAGVQTLYVQASRWDSPTDVLEPERLLPLLAAARREGIEVVAWYLPRFEDPDADLRRLLAIAALGVDGIALDIEDRTVADVAERNRRLVALVTAVRAALPGMPFGAIVLPPVLLESVNPAYWPDFPWAALAPRFDAWLPMAYATDRTIRSGWRDAALYTAENIDRLRARIGLPGAAVHPIGGIADATSAADATAFLQAAASRGAIGGSLYDWRTTSPELWPALQGFRARR